MLVRSSDVLRSDGPIVDIVVEKFIGCIGGVVGHLDIEFQNVIHHAVGAFLCRDATGWDATKISFKDHQLIYR